MNTWKYVYGKRYLNSYKKMVKNCERNLNLTKFRALKVKLNPAVSSRDKIFLGLCWLSCFLPLLSKAINEIQHAWSLFWEVQEKGISLNTSMPKETALLQPKDTTH